MGLRHSKSCNQNSTIKPEKKSLIIKESETLHYDIILKFKEIHDALEDIKTDNRKLLLSIEDAIIYYDSRRHSKNDMLFLVDVYLPRINQLLNDISYFHLWEYETYRYQWDSYIDELKSLIRKTAVYTNNDDEKD